MKSMRTQIRNFIRDNMLLGAEREFDDQASFLDLGIIDSTGVIELIAFVEETFHIEVEDDEIVPENFDSVAVVEMYVMRKIAVQPKSLSA